MNDRELLELAARAAGYYDYECTSHSWNSDHDQHQVRNEHGTLVNWNPLDNDGDALRLAVKLGLQMYLFLPDDDIGKPYTEVNRCITEFHNLDPYAATRRAIVRAAAEIGKGM